MRIWERGSWSFNYLPYHFRHFLFVFRSHRSFRFGAWFERHSRSKVLKENTSLPAEKIFTQTDRPDLDEAEQPDIPLHRRTERQSDADEARWWRIMKWRRIINLNNNFFTSKVFQVMIHRISKSASTSFTLSTLYTCSTLWARTCSITRYSHTSGMPLRFINLAPLGSW